VDTVNSVDIVGWSGEIPNILRSRQNDARGDRG
jgi:hypothetical protein